MRPLACLAACLLAGVAHAETGPKDWLDRMDQALESLNYEGTFIYRHGEQMETMQIVHGSDQSGTRERLVSLTGEAREIIRDRDRLTCVWPGSKSVLVEPRREGSGLPSAFPEGADWSSPYYSYDVEATRRVAGQACRAVSITPRDRFRYGYRICIDEDSGMPLQSEIVDETGAVIEQVMFTSISIMDSIPEARFQPVTAGDDFTWHRSEGSRGTTTFPADPNWQVGEKPEGFVVGSNVKRRMAADSDLVQHMVLTDGLASVSVFIAPSVDDEGLYHGTTASGALNAYATVNGDYQVTVLGEVPQATVRMIGDSLHYQR